jgi:hypothetical protein
VIPYPKFELAEEHKVDQGSKEIAHDTGGSSGFPPLQAETRGFKQPYRWTLPDIERRNTSFPVECWHAEWHAA